MNGTATRFLRLSMSLVGLVTLGWVLTGQAAKPAHRAVSLPTDWSHRHLIFSHPGSPERAARLSQDPRYAQQINRRQQRLALPVGVAEAEASVRRTKLKIMSQKLHPDWAEDLGAGGSVGAGNYPAKFSFDITTSLCDAATTPDYVVFGTGLPASGTQASVVAYDNLYFGCSGATPLGYWGYNTGSGTSVKTSPVLSIDGSEIAYVQTDGSAATLVTLKWVAKNGTVALPANPTLVTSMAGCTTAPCMTQTRLFAAGGIIPTDDSTSSVFYDYSNDIGWVGDASGWLHKITGLFNGTPTEVTTGGFPAQVNLGISALSSPVYDNFSNTVFVGDLAGFLYRVDATGTVTASGRLDYGTGDVDGPIVDSPNQFVYVFSSSDGTSSCATGTVDCSAVFQLSTTFAAGTKGHEVSVGNSSTVLGLGTTPNPLFLGGFDSAYYDSVGVNAATGNLYVCGNTGSNPTVYQIPIKAGAFPLSGQGLSFAQLAITPASCSPVTDIPNENLPGGFSERLFVSVQSNASSAACVGSGCVLNFVSAPWITFTNYAVGQQILSTRGHVETVIQAGTSAFFPLPEPTWTTQISDTVTDGNPGNQVIWIDQGAFDAPFSPYAPSHTYVTLLIKILDPFGNVQALTTTGTTGATPPTWNTTPGLTTADGTAVWTNVGLLGTAATPVAGGTSGIIVDNTVGPMTTVGASQIYFSTLSDQLCGAAGPGGCAVQVSQPTLQ